MITQAMQTRGLRSNLILLTVRWQYGKMRFANPEETGENKGYEHSF